MFLLGGFYIFFPPLLYIMNNPILFLHSSKATNNIFKLDKPIEGVYQLVSFVATNNIFNVNDYNNKVYWNENGTDFTTTLTNGYYNSSDFITHLDTQMTVSGSGSIGVTFNENTRKLTITDTLNFYFTFGTNTTNSARKLLGFSATNGSSAGSQTSDICADLNTNKNVFISFQQDNNKFIHGIDFFDCSCIINGTGDFGEVIRYVNEDNFNQYVKFKKTKQLEVRFHDSSNNNIDLNSEYQILLEKC